MHSSVTELAAPDLTCQLENWIEQRTSRRIRDLSVEIVGRRVVVHGHTGSYYVRQLALAAVLDVLQPEWAEQVDMDIDVDKRRHGFAPSWFETSAVPIPKLQSA